jgi:hypothetical protein
MKVYIERDTHRFDGIRRKGSEEAGLRRVVRHGGVDDGSVEQVWYRVHAACSAFMQIYEFINRSKKLLITLICTQVDRTGTS